MCIGWARKIRGLIALRGLMHSTQQSGRSPGGKFPRDSRKRYDLTPRPHFPTPRRFTKVLGFWIEIFVLVTDIFSEVILAISLPPGGADSCGWRWSSPFLTTPSRCLGDRAPAQGTEPQPRERPASAAHPPDPQHFPSHLAALRRPLLRELSRLGELPPSAHARPRMRLGRSAWSRRPNRAPLTGGGGCPWSLVLW